VKTHLTLKQEWGIPVVINPAVGPQQCHLHRLRDQCSLRTQPDDRRTRLHTAVITPIRCLLH